MLIGLLSNDGQGSSLGSDLSLRQIREQTDEKFTHTAAAAAAVSEPTASALLEHESTFVTTTTATRAVGNRANAVPDLVQQEDGYSKILIEDDTTTKRQSMATALVTNAFSGGQQPGRESVVLENEEKPASPARKSTATALVETAFSTGQVHARDSVVIEDDNNSPKSARQSVATHLVEQAFDAGQEQSRCSIVAEDSDTWVVDSPNPKRQSMATSLVKDALADGQHQSRVSVVVDTGSSEQQNQDSSEDNQESVSVLQSSVEAAPPADVKPDVPSSSVESVDIQSGAEASRQTVTDTDQDNSTSREDAPPAIVAPRVVPASPPPTQQPVVVPVVEMLKPPVMDLPPILTPTPKPVVEEEKAVIVPAAPVSPSKITVQADIGGNATKIVLERDASVKQVWDAVRAECDRLQIKGHLSSIVNASGVALPGKDGHGMTSKHGLTELATISVVVIPEQNTSDSDVKKESSQSDLDIKAHMREAAQKPLLNEQIILGDEPAKSKNKRAQTFSPSRKSQFSRASRPQAPSQQRQSKVGVASVSKPPAGKKSTQSPGPSKQPSPEFNRTLVKVNIPVAKPPPKQIRIGASLLVDDRQYGTKVPITIPDNASQKVSFCNPDIKFFICSTILCFVGKI